MKTTASASGFGICADGCHTTYLTPGTTWLFRIFSNVEKETYDVESNP